MHNEIKGLTNSFNRWQKILHHFNKDFLILSVSVGLLFSFPSHQKNPFQYCVELYRMIANTQTFGNIFYLTSTQLHQLII